MGKKEKPAAKQKRQRTKIVRLPVWFDEDAEKHRRRIEEDERHARKK